jgi:phenylacetyl-CoA:acceptor oxidoreductase subunit 2
MTIIVLFGALLIARFGLWLAYRRRIECEAAREARAGLDGAGRVLAFAGTLVPIALAGIAAFAVSYALPLVALAGLSAAVSGATLKLAIVTRAAFNQGFSVARMPVRGVRR